MGLNCTGKSFSEACNICRTCCVPKLFWMSKQIKNSNLCTQHVLQVSELTIFMNKEQSVVILWVSWCKNKSFWQRFTCTRLFSFKNDWHIFCTFYMIMRWFHTLSHQFLLVLIIFVTFWQIDHTISSLWWHFLTRQFLSTWNIFVSTGIPRIVRFFGPQQTALLEKPH